MDEEALALGRALEQAEAESYAMLFEQVAPAARQRFGLQTAWLDGALVRTMTALDESTFNCAMALGSTAPVTPDLLARIEARFQAAGRVPYLQVAPFATPANLPAWLTARGYTTQAGDQVYWQPRPAALPAPEPLPPSVQIRRMGPGDLDPFMQVARQVFDFGAGGEEILAALAVASLASPQMRCYLVTGDGSPAGIGMLRLTGAIGGLYTAAVVPAWRGRGLHTALIRHRLAAAWRHGARGCTTQTGPGTLSEHNIRRAGFHLAYQRVDFIGQSPGNTAEEGGYPAAS